MQQDQRLNPLLLLVTTQRSSGRYPSLELSLSNQRDTQYL
jgi:hypothetical protein